MTVMKNSESLKDYFGSFYGTIDEQRGKSQKQKGE